ncbi:uncharacterized protein N7483_010892 [Penicillium malachiteum]|uniref:uncharacterized protein n=1 Tax=Penicillium malachiteum TaxID=1324776 RepID=UPI002546E6DC|nr:uncharacterized protein N7483_010892 [Penicillium malachiteum]KAJ5713711.1 hypothetical protein N7483_010892 [Penicillium malachiteum]
MATGSTHIEPDISDADSSYPSSEGAYTKSVTSSALNYRYENGRRYHSYHEGEYVLPNDEQEQERLDLSHHIYLLLLGGELFKAPIQEPRRILDLGTGTGLWAMDFADEHPETEVIGIDLSPIQPSWVPPNCRFEVDDFEQPWAYGQPFDYIHGRELEGSIRDHDNLFQQTFDNLSPGGWFEMATIAVDTNSDDGTHLKATYLLESVKNMHAASKSFGKDMTSVCTWKERYEKIGFVNIKEDIVKLPQSPWAKDPKLKELGRYHQLNMLEAMPPYTFALFTRQLDWKRAEIEVLVAGVRRELKDLSNHLYTKVYTVYGQKPS